MAKHKWIYWIKLVTGVLIVGFLFREIDRRESILEALQNTDISNVVICLLLLIPNVFLAFLKWRYLLKNRFPEVAGRAAFGSLMFGYTLGLVTPGRLGELGRGLFFPRRERLTITGLNLLDKAANQICVFTLGCAALGVMIYQQRLVQWDYLSILLGTGLFLVALGWLALMNPRRMRRLFSRFYHRLKPESKLKIILGAYDQLTRKDILVVMSLTLLWFAVIILQYHVLVRAFTQVSLLESWQAVSATLFAKTLVPLTFGDLGIRESISVFFYSQFAVSQAAVFNASLLIFLINFLLPALSGIYYVFQLREARNGRRSAPADVPAGQNGMAAHLPYEKQAE